MGMFAAYLGSDGNYYVEAEERACGSGSQYKYSDGTQVGRNGTRKKWFKVEPIVWRVLNKDSAGTGTALLLAENILTGGIPWDDNKNIYMESNIRKWLNSNNDVAKQSDYGSTTGFLKTAFTPVAQENITETTVDNSAKSTSDKSGSIDEAVDYVCDNTIDKIFLLSEFEATYMAYGFAEYDVHVGDSSGTQTSTRIRVTTDYAKATGASQSSTPDQGGRWWLRSPFFRSGANARCISNSGNANQNYSVKFTDSGVVPALCIP